MIVELLGYNPDADPNIVGVLTSCSAAVPTFRGMKGAPSPADAGLATLAATCQGAAVLVKLDGTTRFIAGTAKQLYEAGNSTWTNVSQAATYTGGTTARWRFAQQENVSFAANGADTIQASVSTGPFSCIPGAPIADIVEVVGKFVFALKTSANPHGVQWSALGNYANWSVSVATQAGSDTLTSSPGFITAGRRFGSTLVVYKKNSMYLGINEGPPNVWRFDLLPGTAGALSQEVVVNIGTPENPKHVFMGDEDFYIYDGSKPVPIGTGRLKLQVFGELNTSRYYACNSLHDRKNNLVYFYYPTVDSPIPNKCVVYNYRKDRWGVDDRSVEATAEFVSAALTYDGLGARYSTYDDFTTLAYDLAFLGSTQVQPAIFDTNHVVKTLTGISTSSSITTGDYGDDANFSTLNRVRPRFLVKPTTARMTNYYKNNQGDNLTSDTTTDISNGSFDVIRDARWHRVQMNMTGDWEMSGFYPEWVVSGRE